MAFDAALAERVRQALAGRDAIEKKMMGGLCFMLEGGMCCGVVGAALMVRVGAAAYPRMLDQPYVRPLAMGGRQPKGYVVVDPAGVQTPAALASWVARGIAFVAALPAPERPKIERRRSRRTA